MSAMAVASGMVRSTLNPDAPLFIPAAIRRVEDFSPEWWQLVKTTTWFRDHWFRQNHHQESFDGDDDEEEEEDVAILLPDSVDLDAAEEFSRFEAELAGEAEQMFYSPVGIQDKHGVLEMDAAAVIKSLSLKSPRNGPAAKLAMEPGKYKEKPVQCVSPKPSPRRIIQQPR